MKSLNRTLSLVLVLAMVLGLMGFASAATFTDATTIQYTEAVSVMSGIGAINGYTDGTFKPTATITREEAAKLVAYTVLGAATAKTLSVTTTGFSDVAATRWSAPYISYLVSNGIINGMGDGTFAPTGNVTGYQLAKMLLCAIGYGAKGEFVGNSWELNTAIAANKNHILANSKATSFSTAATREEAALYCFNALWVDQVSYNKAFDTYLSIFDEDDASIAESVYPSLKLSSTTTDSFGRPASVWVYGTPATAIAVAPSTPILTYTTGVTLATIKLAIANAGYSYGSTTVPVVRNNGSVTNVAIDGSTPGYDLTTTVQGGNGVAIEVFGNSTTGLVTKIVVVPTYLGTVTITKKDVATTTTVDERAITVTVAGFTHDLTASATAKTPGFDAVYAAAAAAAAAGTTSVALVTPKGDNSASDTAITVAVPKTATLTAAAYTANSFVAGTTTYKYAGTFTGHEIADFSAHVVYFDAYGYVIGTDAVASAGSYAVLLRSAEATDTWGLTGTYKAELLYADGTVATVSTGATKNDSLVGKIVSYTIGSSNVYALETATTATLTDVSASVTTGVSKVTLGSDYYANAKTLFFVRSGSVGAYTYKTYLGIANVPSLTATSTVDGAIAVDGVLKMAYITNATDVGTSTSNKIIVTALGQEITTQVSGVTTSYYLTPAVVNGTITTLKLASQPVLGVYTSMTTNAAGFVTLSGTAPTTNNFSDVKISSGSGVLKVNGVYYGYTTDCAVYSYNADDYITASSIGALATEITSTGTFAVNTLGQITAIIFYA